MSHKMDSYYYKVTMGKWVHRSPIKVFVNPILRFVQFWTNTPFLIASVTEFRNDKPYFVRYSIRKIFVAPKCKGLENG